MARGWELGGGQSPLSPVCVVQLEQRAGRSWDTLSHTRLTTCTTGGVAWANHDVPLCEGCPVHVGGLVEAVHQVH